MLGRELLRKGALAHLRVALEHHTELVENMLPGMVHAAFAVRSVLLHKTQRMVRKETRIRLTAVLHLAIHPANARERVVQNGFIIAAAS